MDFQAFWKNKYFMKWVLYIFKFLHWKFSTTDELKTGVALELQYCINKKEK